MSTALRPKLVVVKLDQIKIESAEFDMTLRSCHRRFCPHQQDEPLDWDLQRSAQDPLNRIETFNGRISEKWGSRTLDSDSRNTNSDQSNCAVNTLNILNGERTDSSETLHESHRFNGISVDGSAISTPLLYLTRKRHWWSEHYLLVFVCSPVTCKAALSDWMT